MPRIRYIAILSEHPRELATFYRESFALRELETSAVGDVVLSDGAVKLTIFQIRGDLGEARMEPGLHHLGVAVDDFERVKARFRRHDPRGVMVPEMPGIQYGELRFYDPESNPVSLSKRNFDLAAAGDGLSRFCHAGFDVLDPDAMADFYRDVFGFAVGPTGAGQERPDRTVDDGRFNLEFHSYFGPRSGHEARYGIHHLGLAVEGAATLAARLSGRAAPSGHAVRDPDGNQLLLLEATAVTGVENWRRSA